MKAVALLILSLSMQLEPRLKDGRLEQLGPSSRLTSDFDSLRERISATAWAGYPVPGDDDHLVLFRIARGEVEKVRVTSSDCAVDLDGLTLYWWSSVPPRESIALIRSLAESHGNGALAAIAQHPDPLADEVLDAFASPNVAFELRKKALFWMGAARGEEGYRRLRARFQGESNRRIKEQIVFALHLSKAEGSIAELVRIARADGDSEVREKALFWLAQKAGARAAETIKTAVDEDPDLEVKKKAVFALSQLPPDEGIPLLVEVAETHRHPEVRKKAFFWLGQSGDPRALALFEQVLSKR